MQKHFRLFATFSCFCDKYPVFLVVQCESHLVSHMRISYLRSGNELVLCIIPYFPVGPYYPVKWGELKKVTVPGKMCLCKKVRQSQWSRRKYFARTRRVRQEAKEDRARLSSMIARGNGIVAKSAKRHSARDAEPCSRVYASQRSLLSSW